VYAAKLIGLTNHATLPAGVYLMCRVLSGRSWAQTDGHVQLKTRRNF